MRQSKYAILIVGALAPLVSAASRATTTLPYLDNVQRPISHEPQRFHPVDRDITQALQDVLDALESMQETYFDAFAGTWADAIDWTAAVTGAHVTFTLNGIVEGLDLKFEEACSDILRWENLVNQYYTQTAFFYFGENAFGLRNQAYDDMLWVVLGWLESTKFADLYARRHAGGDEFESAAWYGLQLSPMAAHRARVFYELAAVGWDDSLCGGGMTWNPSLTPYKNAITNELYTAASISMYLYFPGDNDSSPFLGTQGDRFYNGHDPVYLENAVKSYKWLKESRMRNAAGLYQDGFHVTGWHRFPNGTINPGTGLCDDLNTMVYTYNQGVLLTASRGLWLATGARSYLDDGHDLVSSVIRATGWPNEGKDWHGLGRGGVLEEYCDHGLYCSQDGQTFKGIFFTHLTEFCRPPRPYERESTFGIVFHSFDEEGYRYHLARCAAYAKWIEHNADAALATKNEDGLFGMWWSVPYESDNRAEWEGLASGQRLPDDAVDHLNPISYFRPSVSDGDLNDRGRGRTVETQGSALAVLRAKWMWQALYR
ncbi:hypothetical protein PMZ80_002689 [Knufia obscura]|uniref:Glycosyl hydrolase n=1 Tax=Knufia obscura TaxID=1635080 RepID=A0ABR0RZ06_9EURO|nr:hypothetical protein PMZ80_002689 [Knufia obscura]